MNLQGELGTSGRINRINWIFSRFYPETENSKSLSPHFFKICAFMVFNPKVKKSNVDNKANFRYRDDDSFPLMEATICWTAAEAGTQ
jgi:hypothetical protein